MEGGSGRLALDRLDGGAAVEVVLLEGTDVVAGPPREPHRHDYHELIWVREGAGEHLIDEEMVPVCPESVTVIGRGQVHQFRRAVGIHGGVLRFTDEVLHGDAERIRPSWLLVGGGGRAIPVPRAECGRTSALFEAIHAEIGRRKDPYSADVERHLIATVLLWLERWYDASGSERREAGDADVQLLRRFVSRLEEDFATHHDAAHYADALAMPGPALAQALIGLTGRTTKELVTDRVMLEAARLLRFTDRSVGEVAWQVGFDDPFYFSRAFKRQRGISPQAYRDAARGA